MCAHGRTVPQVSASGTRLSYCTFAVTDDEEESVKVQLFLLLPPLEHAPDQTASRPPETLSVMLVPVAKDAVPELPVAGNLQTRGAHATSGHNAGVAPRVVFHAR